MVINAVVVTEHVRNLLHVMTIYQRLQRQNQLKLVTPAAKTQPRFFNDQTGEVPLTHRKYAGPLSQRLPLRGLPRHRRDHSADFRVIGNRQLHLLLRLLREFIK